MTLSADVAVTVNTVIQSLAAGAPGADVGLATFDVHTVNDDINTLLANG